MFRTHSRLVGEDRRLALLVIFGVSASAAILPFSFWRMLQGQWLVAMLEIGLVAFFGLAIWYAWRFGRISLVARSAAFLLTGAALVLSFLIDGLMLLWAAPILLVNLMLGGPRLGLVLNLVVIVGLLLLLDGETTRVEQATFAGSGLLVSLYGYLFAIAADTQQATLESLATFDELTGAGNRRMMEHDLREAMASAQKHGISHALAVIDLDHFKKVNDTYGHEAGDRVLKALVEHANQALRSKDRLYRMGGEEFVLLLPETDEAGLELALDRLQEHLRPRLKSPGGPVTVSMGGALLQADDEGWSQWLARADHALYAAKDAGRDRVGIAPAPEAFEAEMPRRRANERVA